MHFLAHSVTCSFGVANYQEQGHSTEALFDTADANLYIAKKSGRNKVSA
ncbi:diguanylate cyclase domain-containing protein [Psychromonas sp. GE-S-Ul-11]